MSELTSLQVLMIEAEIKEIGDAIMSLHKSYTSVLTEAVDDFLRDDGDLGYMFDEAKKRFLAAKQGLALTNRLKDPQSRQQNKSRVMSNLNKLRSIYNSLFKAIENLTKVAQGESQQRDTFQQRPTSPGITNTFSAKPAVPPQAAPPPQA